MANVGVAYITIAPSFKGFQTAAAAGMTAPMAAAGAAAGNKAGDSAGGAFSSKLGKAAKLGGLALGGAAVIGAVSFVKNSGRLEAEFSKTMNKFQAASGATSAEMKSMQGLALKMGADTVFSASEAADAMLALAKSGMSPATIQAGALRQALALAAADGLEMGRAAEIMGNTINTFNLKGSEAARVSNALAGAANSSSASVDSIAQGLQQFGAVAADSSQTVEGTTAAIAALAQAGIAGSDAGTSLKTMFARLQPTTAAARDAFENFGLSSYQSTASLKELNEMGIKPVSSSMGDVTNAIRDYLVRTGQAGEGTMKLETMTKDLLYSTGMMQNAFIKSNGEFKSVTQIAGILEEKFGDLSAAERAAALETLFGSDARRAASVLTKEGAEGLARYVRATSNQTAAEKMAQAGMKGTAGALEQLKGSWETLQLQFGLFTAPLRVKALNFLTSAVNAVVPAIKAIAGAFSGSGGGVGRAFSAFASSASKVGKEIMAVLVPGFKEIGKMITGTLLPAFAKMLPVITPVVSFIFKMLGTALVGLVKGAIQVITGIVQVITGVVKTIGAIFKGDWKKAWEGFKLIVKGALNVVIGAFKVWLNIGIFAVLKAGIKKLLSSWKGFWDGLVKQTKTTTGAISKTVTGWFTSVRALFIKWIKAYVGFWKGLLKDLQTLAVNAFRVLTSKFGGFFAAVKTAFTQAINLWKSLWTKFFTAIRDAAVTGWRVTKEKFTAAFSAVRTALTTAVGNWKDIWTRMFTAIRDQAVTWWGRIESVFTRTFTAMKGAFRTAVTAISTIWDNLKEAAARPVRFVVNTVYNKGIVKVVNAIPGVPDLSEISIGFARGGWTGPGPKYKPAGVVHADEFVINKESRGRIERDMPGFLDNLNGYAIGGRVKAGIKSVASKVLGIDALDITGFISDLKSSFGDWGGMMSDMIRSLGGGLKDWISQQIKAALAAVVGSGGGGGGSANGLTPTMAKAYDFVKATWPISTIYGYSNRMIAGTNTKSDHAYGKALDIMTTNVPLGNQIANYFATGAGKFRFNIENTIWNRRIHNAQGWHAYTGSSPHTDHVHIDTYDGGGILPPGMSLAYNGTGAGEHKAVFTADQWRTLREMAGRGVSQQPLVRYENVHVTNLDELIRVQKRDSRRAQVLAAQP